MDERSSVRPVQDTRRPAYGWGRILVGVFAVFGAIVLVPSLTTLLRSPDEEPAVWSLNLLGGVLYLLLAVCVAHNGRRMRNIGWMCLGALATMAVLIGVLTLPTPSPADLSVSVGPLGSVPVVPACDPPGGRRCVDVDVRPPAHRGQRRAHHRAVRHPHREHYREGPGGPGGPGSQDVPRWSGPVRRCGES